MTNRRSPPTAGGRSHGRNHSSSSPSASATVQSNVTQFFSATPAQATNSASRSAATSRRPTETPAASSGPASGPRMSSSTAPAPASTIRPTYAGVAAMEVESGPSREDPADPIVDSSPRRGIAPDSIRPPRSPPNSRARRSQSQQRSPSGRGSPSSRRSRSHRSRNRSAPTSPATTTATPLAPLVPGRGGRAPVGSVSSSSGRGRGRSIQESRTPRSASMQDVPMAEARLVSDGVTTCSQRAAPAVAMASVLAPNPPARPPASSSQSSRERTTQNSSQTSPNRGGFQALLDAEVQALQAERNQQAEDTASGGAAATAPSAPGEDTDMSDAATVATDNTEGSFVQMFVHQPVAATVPTSVGIAPRPRQSTAPRPPGPTLQSTNPYLRTELLPPRSVEARYEMRLQLAPSSNADAELRSTLVAFFAKLREYDPTLVIHPWSDRDNTTQQNGQRQWRSLAKPDDIPATMDGMRRYFPRALPKPTGGFVYPSIHLGHSRPFTSLKHDLSWWFQSERHGLWPRQLQCESTYIVGWGLYSLQSIDVPALKRVLEEALGFPLGLRWRTIQTGQAGAIPPDQMAKALHFEVNRLHKREAKRRLADLYARTATRFPLGIKMRLVWPLSDVMNLRTREKVAALRLRQLQFCTHMRGMRTWELHSIDQPDSETNLTLRARLMEIRSTVDGHQLFHSVDPSHIGEGAMQFAFHPAREQEARAMIIALIPYLRWKMAEEVPNLSDVARERFFAKTLYCHFSKDALDRAVGAVWNPTTMTVDSPADDYNGWVFDSGDGELDCSGFGDDATPASTLTTAITSPLVRPHDAAGDQDSVSTLPQGTSLASTASTGSQSTTNRGPPDPGVGPSAATTASSISSPSDHLFQNPNLQSFLTSLTSLLSTLPDSAQTQDLRSQLASLTSASSASPSTPPSATGQGH